MLPLWLTLSLLLPVWAQSNTPNATSATQLPFNITEATVEGDANYSAPIFPLLPFNKYSGNPILTPNPANNWESAYLYNPTAIVLNETIFLLYRAQNESKTSSIGLAWSTDGVNFTRLAEPILYATEPWEQIGGTEGCGSLCFGGVGGLRTDAANRSSNRAHQQHVLHDLYCIR
jgi:hypothetical protein